MDTKEAGKKGSLKRWGDRYSILVELSKYTDKELQNTLIKWKQTTRLSALLDFFKRNGVTNNSN